MLAPPKKLLPPLPPVFVPKRDELPPAALVLPNGFAAELAGGLLPNTLLAGFGVVKAPWSKRPPELPLLAG